ncbi:MAG: GNAT family N-acetyltransferase [Promethearchaeota archaeon]
MNDLDSKLKIRIANIKDFFDLKLCAKEFIDFISDFKKKFLNNVFFILTGYYNNVLAAILIAEDKSNKIDSIERIIPTINLYLLYVNPKYRKKQIGKKLLETFINVQKERGIGYIIIKLPQKYKKGINFFKKNNFFQIGLEKNKVILAMNLWNDFGIRDYQIIEEDLNDMLS